jgi:hypothetical protein
LAFGSFDRMVFVGLYRRIPGIIDALSIIQPETVVRWHRAGFRLFWRWKARRRGGRPRVPLEIRRLIRTMNLANPLWGAPPVHGELLKLGIDVGQTSVAKYVARRRGGPSQGWRIFLCNHADGIASMELFVVPTLSFQLLYGFLILRHRRRRIMRLIGSIRKEALDHVVVLGERHLRLVPSSYLTYHNEARTHLSLNKDAPVPRAVQGVGRIFAKPHIGGLHHNTFEFDLR